MNWSDPRTIFAFAILAVIAWLAYAIAVKDVQEAHSYGLHELLIILAVMGKDAVDGLYKGPKQ